MVALLLLPLISPAVLPPGYEDTPWCPPGSCLEQTRQPDGFTGPQSEFFHCHDPESKVLALGAREVQEIWTGSKVATEPPDGWVVASPCPPYPMPPPPPPSPPGAFVCLLHAGTFFPKVQAFASVRLETDHKNHCLVGGALGGLGSGQSIGDASFPSVPQDAMDETHRKPHSCCWFRGEMLEAEGARRVRVDLWDYDTFSENDYLGGAFFDLGDLAPASARADPPEDDNDEPSDAGLHPSSEGGGGLFGLFGGGEAAPPPPVVVTKRIATAAPEDTADFSLTVSLTRTIPSDSALPVEKWGHPQKLMRQGLLDGLEEFAKTLQQIPCFRGECPDPVPHGGPDTPVEPSASLGSHSRLRAEPAARGGGSRSGAALLLGGACVVALAVAAVGRRRAALRRATARSLM